MRFERHDTRFISSKSILVNFQQGWKNKPQVAMKLPDFCLAPLKSSLLSKLLYPPPNPSVGCWGPRAWSVYHFKRPTYACAKNEATLCLFYVVLTWAPLTTFQIALPPHHSTHSLYSPIHSYLLLVLRASWKFTKVLFELINRVRAWRSNRILFVLWID